MTLIGPPRVFSNPLRNPESGCAGKAAVVPLDGIRVADFSWVGAGPFSTKPLADHGGRQDRVAVTEGRHPVDAPFRDGVPGVERSGYFADRNSSKQSICLDLHPPSRS
jgi:benzylsuccinate CoA-transferase BbsF subunit